ncbi:hypothetical protein NI17_006640 [Thermobifida halotolerans]|uniref:Uncharacterized protein n=1 Tax=Thermobifida halotolerans TaxID=483545 RepID=A0A399G452_9ACTN|nr:hypothetical protein [Thermobifida halotolerans]UOE20853.1 hypothetical protein NI17_006640 [Thermobifida halotolerans]
MELFGVTVTYVQAGVLASMAVMSYAIARVRAKKARDDYYIKMTQEKDRAMKDRPRTQKLIRETLQYENIDPETGVSLKRHEINKRMASLREQHGSKLKSIREKLDSSTQDP